jgi:putative DNA primase/helicase
MEAVRAEIMHFYRLYVDCKQEEVIANAADPKDLTKQEKQYLAALQGLLSKTSLDAITSLASGLVLESASIFDDHPDLLNARNGVVDLRTGQLQPHDPTLYLMKMANVDYRPEAIDVDGLETILGCVPDEETRDWLQIRFGQAATGYPPPDDLLTVLHGGGSNGKSTLLGGVQHTLDDKVLIGDSTSHSTEKTDLLGARLALAEEVPGGVELNMSSIKKITGSTKIKARKMRMDTIEWSPTHSIFLTSNYQPIVKATDHGTWRRLAKVTFPLRYRDPHDALEGPDDRRGDPALRARVEDRDEKLMAGFLAWMVEGARRWYEKGRAMPAVPAKVVKETLEWRAETDLIMGFIRDTLEFDPRSNVLITEAYEEFVSWMEKAGMRPWSLTIFKARFLEHSEVVSRRVVAGRTRAHADLSRPPRMARMTLPTGPATVFHGVAFSEGEQPRFRVVSD